MGRVAVALAALAGNECSQFLRAAVEVGVPLRAITGSQPTAAVLLSGSRAPLAAVRIEVTVVVGNSEPIESAIRRFKKDVTKSGHLFELRRRRYFETNTEKRLRKAAAARRKARMARNMKASRSRQQGSRNSTSTASNPSQSPVNVTPLTPGTAPPNPRI